MGVVNAEIKRRIGDDGDFQRRCDRVNDCEGRRVLHFAAGMGLTDMCEFLIEEVNVEVDIQTERGIYLKLTPFLIRI